jgi:citrate synthase
MTATTATAAAPSAAATASATAVSGAAAAESALATTRLSAVDGERGELLIAGYPVEELAPRACSEEAAYLLWNDRLPAAGELAMLRATLAARRELPAPTVDLLRAAAARRLAPMDALRMAVASLSLANDGEGGGAGLAAGEVDLAAAAAEATRLLAAVPAIVATYGRLLAGGEPVAARADLGQAANLLWQLTGEEPAAERVRALDTYLVTVSDHGFNASTFAARVVVSTRASLTAAVTAAVGALAGPLHGGAPGPALDMVFEIGRAERAEEVLRGKLRRGERLMGFGHRIYRVRDPRADVLAAAAERFFAGGGDAAFYALARHVEAVALRLLREHKPDRRLDTNVELYTALLLHGLGLPSELFTPVIAVGRVAGWTAHALEQLSEGRLIRPESRYVGPRGRSWVPVEKRGQ